MENEIKTEDIIESLLICTDFTENCSRCAFNNLVAPNCRFAMGNAAADRLNRSANAGKTVPDDERIMQQAIETYGVQAQCDVAIEEMAELTQVVMKIRRISDDYEETMAARDHLIDEIADVGIMIAQMELMFGAADVEKMRRKKLLRLKKRLELEGADEK